MLGKGVALPAPQTVTCTFPRTWGSKTLGSQCLWRLTGVRTLCERQGFFRPSEDSLPRLGEKSLADVGGRGQVAGSSPECPLLHSAAQSTPGPSQLLPFLQTLQTAFAKRSHSQGGSHGSSGDMRSVAEVAEPVTCAAGGPAFESLRELGKRVVIPNARSTGFICSDSFPRMK